MTSSSSLILRAVEPTDADFMYEVENDAASWRYGDIIAPLSRHNLRNYALNYDADPFSARQLRLIIISHPSKGGVPIGVADLYDIDAVHRRSFVGIYILPSFRREGRASQALKLLENYAMNVLNLRMLAAKIESVNHISLSLFKRSGYLTTAVIPEWFNYAGSAPTDLIILTKNLVSKGKDQ